MAKKKRRRLDFDICKEVRTSKIFFQRDEVRGVRYSKELSVVIPKGKRYWFTDNL